MIGRGSQSRGPLNRSSRADTHQKETTERLMAKLRLLKAGHGDLCLAEWDPKLPETVREAEARFRENLTPGRMAFRLDGPGQSRPIREFDAKAPEILLVPAIQGG